MGPVVLDRAIGQGAWGIVYEGRHDTWGHVAIKEYFPSTYASRSSRGSLGSSAPQWQDAVRRGLERFGQEGRALKAIRHENVVPVYEYLENEGSALLVMEFVEGRTLSAAYDAGQFHDAQSVMALGSTLIDTLQAIHAKNVLHRDIAPDNIMIRADGSPVLIDFGGAAAAVAGATRSTNNVVKDGYSPPEQYDTSANPTFPVGPWSDIYATSAVLYRLASGREPAVANARLLAAGSKSGTDPMVPLTTIAPAGYPKTWLHGIDAGLALLPKDRPQNAVEWRKAFEHAGPAVRRGLSPAAVIAAVVGTAAAAVAATVGIPRLMHPAAAPVVAQHAATPAAHVATRKPVAHVTHRAGPTHAPVVVQQQQAPPVVVQQVAAPVQAPPRIDVVTPKPVVQKPAVRHTPKVVAIATVAPVVTPVPTPVPTAVPTPVPTPVPTAVPTPVPTPVPPPTRRPRPTIPIHPVATPILAAVTDVCASGYVWRATVSTDHVCVTTGQRAVAIAQNGLAATRRNPNGGAYGAATCLSGFVWRNAYAGDTVCVTPAERDAAAQENVLGPSRRAH